MARLGEVGLSQREKEEIEAALQVTSGAMPKPGKSDEASA